MKKEEAKKKSKISELSIEEKREVLIQKLAESQPKIEKLSSDIKKYQDKYNMNYAEFAFSKPKKGEQTDDFIDWGFLENAKDELEETVKKIKRFLKKNPKAE